MIKGAHDIAAVGRRVRNARRRLERLVVETDRGRANLVDRSLDLYEIAEVTCAHHLDKAVAYRIRSRIDDIEILLFFVCFLHENGHKNIMRLLFYRILVLNHSMIGERLIPLQSFSFLRRIKLLEALVDGSGQSGLDAKAVREKICKGE